MSVWPATCVVCGRRLCARGLAWAGRAPQQPSSHCPITSNLQPPSTALHQTKPNKTNTNTHTTTNHKRWLTARIDGSTSVDDRQSAVDGFNRGGQGAARVFLLSTRAGGAGLNLVGASTLVLLDCDWNPAMDRFVRVLAFCVCVGCWCVGVGVLVCWCVGGRAGFGLT